MRIGKIPPGLSTGARANSAGFTLLMVLATLAVVSVMLSVAAPAWAERSRRDKEDQLLRVGAAYASAIRSYYLRSPGFPKQYPPSLEALVEDRRFVSTERHLRRLYPDPISTPDNSWGLVKTADGRIKGVYSTSQEQPIRSAPVDLTSLVLSPAKKYSDWKFIPVIEP